MIFLPFLLLSLYAAESELPTQIITTRRGGGLEGDLPSEFQGQRLEIPKEKDQPVVRTLGNHPAIQTKALPGSPEPTFIMRGLSPIQNRVFLEGVPLSDAQFQGQWLESLPSSAIGSAEVFASGVPSTFLSDGIGGGVNLTLSREGRRLGIGGGSFNGYQGFAKGGILEPFQGYAVLDYRQSQENFPYFDDGGTPFESADDQLKNREHNGYRRAIFIPQVWLSRDWKYFGITSYQDNEIPGALDAPMEANLTRWGHLSAIKGNWRVQSGWSSNFLLYGRWNGENFKNEIGPTVLLRPTSQSRLFQGGVRTIQEWRLASGLEGSAGMGVEAEAFRHQLPSSTQENQRGHLPVSASLAWEVEKFRFNPAVESGFYFYEGNSRRNIGHTSPRLGVEWVPLSGLRMRSAIGYYYRVPTMQELFGTSNGITSSPELKPETAEKGEVGIDIEMKEWGALFSYTFSVARAHNLISLLPNSQSTRIATNIGESEILSHELSSRIAPKDFPIQWHAGITFLSTTNLSDVSYQKGKEVPYRPRLRWQTGVEFNANPWYGDYTIEQMGEVFSDVANVYRMDGWTEHHVGAGFRTQDYGNFRLEIRNLLNVITSQTQVGGFEWKDLNSGYPGYPIAGRRIAVLWQFDF